MATAPPAWAYLPNAAHIDRVLADLKARHEVWDAAQGVAWSADRSADRSAARDAAWDAAQGTTPALLAWDAALGAARDAALGAARDAAWNAAWNAARGAAWDAGCALAVWGAVGYVLDLTPGACRMLIHTAEGHHKHAAVLLLPAVIALTTQ